MQNSITLPDDLATEVKKQVKEGKFASQSDFIKSAVKTYLNFQKGNFTWDILAAPFRAYAKERRLTQKDVLEEVQKGRREDTSKSGK